jgi:hypothetical protein
MSVYKPGHDQPASQLVDARAGAGQLSDLVMSDGHDPLSRHSERGRETTGRIRAEDASTHKDLIGYRGGHLLLLLLPAATDFAARSRL